SRPAPHRPAASPERQESSCDKRSPQGFPSDPPAKGHAIPCREASYKRLSLPRRRRAKGIFSRSFSLADLLSSEICRRLRASRRLIYIGGKALMDQPCRTMFAAFAAVFLTLAPWSAKAQANGFDFYVLSLSWSPTFCATQPAGRNSLQCGN